MPKFHIHTRYPAHVLLLKLTAVDLNEVGQRLNRERFLVGELWAGCGAEVEEPIDVLIPSHVVTLVAVHKE